MERAGRGLKVAIGLLLTVLAEPVIAGSLELLRDINSQVIPVDSSPTYFGTVGARVIFTAKSGPFGPTELYASDGTTQGTSRVSPIAAPGSQTPELPLDLGTQLLYFTGAGGTFGSEMWRTNGTAAGTRRVTQIIGFNGLQWLGVVSGIALYGGRTDGKFVLSRTDGTETGTARVRELADGSDLTDSPSATIGPLLYFVVASRPSDERTVWETDGSAAGTRAVFTSSGLNRITAFQGKLLLELYDGTQYDLHALSLTTGTTTRLTTTGLEAADFTSAVATGTRLIIPAQRHLWATDGTPSGTEVIATPITEHVEFSPRKYVLLNGEVFFIRHDSSSGSELWVTDGTAAGTRLFFEFTPAIPGTARIVARTPSRAYIVASGSASDNFAQRLWVTDGTVPGTHLVPLANSIASVGDLNFEGYVTGSNLFVTGQLQGPGAPPSGHPRFAITRADLDGTSGERIFDQVMVEAAFPAIGRLFFASDGGSAGLEPWVSDGTPAGTRLLSDIGLAQTNGHSNPRESAELDGTVLFAANDGLQGTELWKTDGTPAGTVLVKDIAAGIESSAPIRLTAINGLVYFLARLPGEGYSFWRTDGTADGTFSLGELNNGDHEQGACEAWIAPLENRVVFGARSNINEYGLWSSDGTAQGMARVADFSAVSPSPSGACHVTRVGSQVLFTMNGAGTQQRQLWRTDGTASGTALVKVINPSGSAFTWERRKFLTLNDVAYFAASDGSKQLLWRSDGTADGTYPAVTLSGSPAPNYVSEEMSVLDGRIIFFASVDQPREHRVYSTDGTTGGTRLLESGLDFALSLASGTNRLYFMAGLPDPASPGNTIHYVWSTDGTESGTRVAGRVRGLELPVVHDDVAFFVNAEVDQGQELWMSDGTTFGTHLVNEIVSGPISSAYGLAQLQGRTIVFGYDEAHGYEPFVLNNVPPTAIADARTVASGSAITIAVSANDIDPDGNVALASPRISAAPANGTATETRDGKIRYVPGVGFSGIDTFGYILTDSSGGASAAASVTVTVNAAPSPPPASGSNGGGRIQWPLLAVLFVTVVVLQTTASGCQSRVTGNRT